MVVVVVAVAVGVVVLVLVVVVVVVVVVIFAVGFLLVSKKTNKGPRGESNPGPPFQKRLTKDRGGNRTQDPPSISWEGGGGGGGDNENNSSVASSDPPLPP